MLVSPTEYLSSLESAYRSGKAREHSYRPAFAALLESRGKGAITALNDSKREKCGAPDYTIFRATDRLTIGWVETKDFGIGSSLDEVVKTEQLQRYFAHLPNLLVTDYLHVRWYVRREQGVKLEGEGHLGRLVGGKIVSDSGEQEKALGAIDAFLRHKPARLTSAKDLAVRLADFTQMIRGIIVNAFAEGETTESLRDWRTAFAHTLLPELAANPDAAKDRAAAAEFADMFAQTLTYGLFSARAALPAAPLRARMRASSSRAPIHSSAISSSRSLAPRSMTSRSPASSKTSSRLSAMRTSMPSWLTSAPAIAGPIQSSTSTRPSSTPMTRSCANCAASTTRLSRS